MMDFQLIPIILISLLVIIVLSVALVYFKKTVFGIIAGKNIYTDTQKIPGEVLYSDTLKLKGKPDYIIKKGSEYIPVEVKTGKTPEIPYKNHVAQLFAYCALVEENYQHRPKYGVIKYHEREFEIEYTEQGENGIKLLILEMMEMKESGEEPQCKHPEHNEI